MAVSKHTEDYIIFILYVLQFYYCALLFIRKAKAQIKNLNQNKKVLVPPSRKGNERLLHRYEEALITSRLSNPSSLVCFVPHSYSSKVIKIHLLTENENKGIRNKLQMSECIS